MGVPIALVVLCAGRLASLQLLTLEMTWDGSNKSLYLRIILVIQKYPREVIFPRAEY